MQNTPKTVFMAKVLVMIMTLLLFAGFGALMYALVRPKKPAVGRTEISLLDSSEKVSLNLPDGAFKRAFTCGNFICVHLKAGETDKLLVIVPESGKVQTEIVFAEPEIPAEVPAEE